jgi:hypothetical protein
MTERSLAYDDVERAVNASAEQAGVEQAGAGEGEGERERERDRATTDAAENENVEEREQRGNANGGKLRCIEKWLLI